MGTLVGHVASGFGFLLIGLWHLLNNIKLHALYPNSFTSSPWFKSPIIRHLELYLIILGSFISISMDLVIGPVRHQPFDHDGTIPSNHLHNFEHSLIATSFIVYAAFAIILDRLRQKDCAYDGRLVYLLAGFASSQHLFLFHFHSVDHMSIENQYHLLLQLLVLVTLATTLMGINFPNSFLISFVRSVSILFQGVWLIFMGLVLWIPKFVPKDCFMNPEEGHIIVRCKDDHALHRAKSLVNLEFSWFFAGIVVFSMIMYLVLVRIYGEKVEYLFIGNKLNDVEDDEEEIHEMESQKKMLDESCSFIHMGKGFPEDDEEEIHEMESQKKMLDESCSFIHMGKGFPPIDMER